MSIRYEREEEFLASAFKRVGGGLRDVQRATGTEKAQTMLTAITAASKADTAAEDALAAATASAAAVTAAAAARFLAEGLYQVIPSVTEPTTSPTGALKAGDQWWVIGAPGTDVDGLFVGVQVYDGVAWIPRQLVANSVLVPGSVGNVLIEDGAVTAESMSSDFFFGREFYGGLFDGAVFRLASGETIERAAVGVNSTAADRAWTPGAGTTVNVGSAPNWVASFTGSAGAPAISAVWNPSGLPVMGVGRLTVRVAASLSGSPTDYTARVKVGAVTKIAGFSNVNVFGTVAFDGVDLNQPITVEFVPISSPWGASRTINVGAFDVTFGGENGALYIDRDPVTTAARLRVVNHLGIQKVLVDVDGVKVDGTAVSLAGHTHTGAQVAAATETARGTVQRATQAKVDAGTDDVDFVTAKKLRDRTYAPYAMAAGFVPKQNVVSTGAVVVTVTFPPGRFTQPPVVTHGIWGAARDTQTNVDDITATSCSIIIGSNSTVTRNVGATWSATQMLA